MFLDYCIANFKANCYLMNLKMVFEYRYLVIIHDYLILGFVNDLLNRYLVIIHDYLILGFVNDLLIKCCIYE